MYLSYYHFTQKPFTINPDPEFLWLGEKHKEALANLEYAIYDDKGFLLLTGDVGVGKTALINKLLKKIGSQVKVQTISDPILTLNEFMNTIAFKFGYSKSIRNKSEFLRFLKGFLIKQAGIGKKVLLIFDEAHKLSPTLLEQIRLLSNIELPNKKLLNIFFVGQNELNSILYSRANRALRQRITVRYQLDPLTKDEIEFYVRHRLTVAGNIEEIFDKKCYREIYRHTRGYPRLINIICDRALITGYSYNYKSIKPSIIKDCSKELSIDRFFTYEDNVALKRFSPKQAQGKLQGKKSGSIRIRYIFIPLLILLFFALTYSSVWPINKIMNPLLNHINNKYHQFTKLDVDILKSTKAGTKNHQKPIISKKIIHSKNKLSIPANSTPPLTVSVYFNHNSSELNDSAITTLKNVLEILKVNTELTLFLEGYANTIGDYFYNKQLSEYRAKEIKKYLTDNGVNKNRIIVEGMGAIQIIEKGLEKHSLQEARRVDMKIFSDKG
jgi:general secretion pathway protein A